MPHASNPSSRARTLMSDDVMLLDRLQTVAERQRFPTSCRSTYGRMPPCRNATSSSGVSMRAIAWNSTIDPPSRAARLQTLRRAGHLIPLSAAEAERCGGGARLELQRQHAHVHEVAAMDALERLGDDHLHAEQQRPFRRP